MGHQSGEKMIFVVPLFFVRLIQNRDNNGNDWPGNDCDYIHCLHIHNLPLLFYCL